MAVVLVHLRIICIARCEAPNNIVLKGLTFVGLDHTTLSRMANQRKRSTRSPKSVNGQRSGNGNGNGNKLQRIGESSNENNDENNAVSSQSHSSHTVKDPPFIIRRQTKQRIPESNLTARKLLWWISISLVILIVVSCVIGFGRSLIIQRQLEQQQDKQKEQSLLEPKDRVDIKDSVVVQDVKRNKNALPKQKQPVRLWKRLHSNLVQGLQEATFIAIAGKFAARGTSSSTTKSTITKDISINQEVIVSVKSTDTDKNDKRKQQLKEELAMEYSNAFTAEPHMTDQQRSLLQQLSLSVQKEWPDIHQRAVKVAWGGPPDLTTTTSMSSASSAPRSYHWWNPVIPHPHHLKHASLENIDGGYLLYSYLNIMNWPETLHTYFPFYLCKGDGCPSASAIGHSLEWREKYQPWMATQSVLTENKDGWIYARGFSPPALTSDPAYGRHAVVWIRPGPVIDSAAYFRCILHAVDRAVALSLQQSSGRVGKFNVMVDGGNYDWSCVPSIKYIKQAVIMLQDHFPDRLGMVFLVNVSLAGEILWRLVKPLLTKEVRDKVKILSSDPDKRMAELETLSEKEYIPDWLGGTDTYRFDTASYYPKSMQWSEEQGLEFMKTMPYHTIS